MSRERALLLLSLVLLMAAGLWWYFSAEYEDRPVYRPTEPRLMTEKYFIAGQVLEQRGRRVSSIERLDRIEYWPGRYDTLVSHAAIGQHNDFERRLLLDWVNGGGHLIAEAPGRIDARDGALALNPWQISRCHYCPAITQDEPQKADTVKQNDKSPPEKRTLILPDGKRLELWGRQRLSIENDDSGLERWEDTEGDTLVARYIVGQGQVTLIASSQWIDNTRLIYPGHARLLEALVGEGPDRIVLQQRHHRGGLLVWLWQQAPLLWSLTLVLLALWIWSRLPRLGPIRSAESGQHRQMREHVLATARFDWRHNQGLKLIRAMREQAALKLARRYPDWHQLDRNRRIERMTGLCPEHGREAIAWYLSLDRAGDADAFTRFVLLHRQLMHAI